MMQGSTCAQPAPTTRPSLWPGSTRPWQIEHVCLYLHFRVRLARSGPAVTMPLRGRVVAGVAGHAEVGQQIPLAHATTGDPMGLMFRIAVLNGERRGELCGLRWSGADLDKGC